MGAVALDDLGAPLKPPTSTRVHPKRGRVYVPTRGTWRDCHGNMYRMRLRNGKKLPEDTPYAMLPAKIPADRSRMTLGCKTMPTPYRCADWTWSQKSVSVPGHKRPKMLTTVIVGEAVHGHDHAHAHAHAHERAKGFFARLGRSSNSTKKR